MTRGGPVSVGVNSWLAQVLQGWSKGTPSIYSSATSFWRLDEASGTRADSIGANDLTDNNTVGFANMGPSGTAAQFVAANTESLSYAGGVLDFTGDWTISLWVWYPDTTGDLRILSTGNLPVDILRPNATAGATIYWKTAAYSQNITLQTAAWNHIVVYQSGTTLGVAVDAQTPSTVAGAVNNAATSFKLGVYSDGTTHPFNGRQARVGGWNRALTSDERTSLYNSGKGKAYADLTTAEKVGLVSYWNLDEASGDRADSHGSNTLTDNNTVTSTTNSYPANLPGTVASFVAANSEYLSLSSQAVITSGAARTVSFWLNRTATAGANDTHFIIANSVGDGSRLFDIVGQGSDPNSQLSLFANGTSTPSAGFYSANQWLFVVYTFDGGTSHKIYVDGTERVSYTGGDSGNSGSLFIGNGPASPADMLMSTVAVWSRVLTSDERTALYNSGDGAPLP